MSTYEKSNGSGGLYDVQTGSIVEVRTDSFTASESDSGKNFLVSTDNQVITLPATKKGLKYRITCIAASGAAKISISPNASDAIYGGVTLASSVVTFAATDNKDVILTKATAVKGDWIEVTADGSTGWVITGSQGIFAQES